MNKHFSKIAALSVGLAMAVGVGVAVNAGSSKVEEVKAAETKVEFTLSSAESVTKDGVTVAFAKGSGSNAPAWYAAGLRLYASNTVTVSSSDTLTGITFNWEKQGSKAFASVTANVGTYSHPSAAGEGVWSGSANEVVFTLGGSGQLQLNTLSATTGSEDHGELVSLDISGSMTKTSYTTADSSWNPDGFVVTGTYEDEYEADVTSSVEWSYNPSVPALNVTNVVATATFGGKSVSSSAQTVSVARVNPIQALYSKDSGDSVDVYGYYVGFLDGTGPVIMDGDYGVVVYNKSADVSGYTEKETILHVTGSISIYKGLYEIGSPTISDASEIPQDKVPSNPVVYAAQGGETPEYASRLTTVTGTPAVVSGSFDADAGTSDITMNFTVGTKTIQVFYKKAAQTADADAFSAIKAAVASSEEITIKGFTGWYNAFQVQMNGVVEAVDSYTAEQFAQDLIDQTDAVCSAYPGDKDPSYNYNDYKSQLVAIWSDLASADKYPSLPSDQKEILANAARDEDGDVVEQAMARYDFLTGKYELSNFINGRTPMANHYNNLTVESSNNMMIIIVVISSITVLSLGILVVLKKKKHN